MLIRTDIRALLPVWIAAVVAVLGGDSELMHLSGVAYAFGACMIAAQSIGHEYGHRTLPALLVHPIDRRYIYAVKLTVLAAMLCALAALTAVWLRDGRTLPWDAPMPVLWPVLGAFVLTPWLTMLCRNTLAGIVFTFAVPVPVYVIALIIAHTMYAWNSAEAWQMTRTLTFTALALLAPVPAILGWRRFRSLEVLEGAGGGVTLPRLIARKPGATLRHRYWHQLVKELQLQQMTLAIAAVFAAVCVVLETLVARGLVDAKIFMVITVMYHVILALLIGSLASAEERRYGTHEMQLVLPLSPWRQWLIKAGTALGLAIVLGLVLPALLVTRVATADQMRAIVSASALAVVTLTSIGMYASSLSTSGVKAMAAAVPAIFVAIALIQFIDRSVLPQILVPTDGSHRVSSAVVALALVAALLGLGFVNHRYPERNSTRVCGQLGAITAMLAVGVWLLSPQ
jgi:ABC-type transport system involved in multi-copper enzyme maturation permease subunit